MRNPNIGHAKLSEVVGFVIIIMAGFVFLSFGALSASEPFNKQKSYATTQGETVEISSAVVSGDRVGNTGFFDEHDYQIMITYQYTVNGTTYEDTNVFADSGQPNIVDDQDRAGKLMQEIVANPTVHYDPQNPSDSYLSANPFDIGTLILLIFGVLTLIQGLYQMYSAIVTRPEDRE